MFADNSKMNKRNVYHLICRVISICLCALFCLSFGCTSKKEERLQEIDFTVVDDDEIPEELKTIIDQKKTGEFKLTYNALIIIFVDICRSGLTLHSGWLWKTADRRLQHSVSRRVSDKREYCCHKCIAWSRGRRTCEYQLSIRGH